MFDYHASRVLPGFDPNVKMRLLPANMIEQVTFLKNEILTGKMVSLDVEETLIMMGISAISKQKPVPERLKDPCLLFSGPDF